jgi:hypothetical protein
MCHVWVGSSFPHVGIGTIPAIPAIPAAEKTLGSFLAKVFGGLIFCICSLASRKTFWLSVVARRTELYERHEPGFAAAPVHAGHGSPDRDLARGSAGAVPAERADAFRRAGFADRGVDRGVWVHVADPGRFADGIIAGHGRLMAARKLGLAEVPVIVLDHLTETQRRALYLGRQQAGGARGWNEDLLAEELAALEADGFELGADRFQRPRVGGDAGEAETRPGERRRRKWWARRPPWRSRSPATCG